MHRDIMMQSAYTTILREVQQAKWSRKCKAYTVILDKYKVLHLQTIHVINVWSPHIHFHL